MTPVKTYESSYVSGLSEVPHIPYLSLTPQVFQFMRIVWEVHQRLTAYQLHRSFTSAGYSADRALSYGSIIVPHVCHRLPGGNPGNPVEYSRSLLLKVLAYSQFQLLVYTINMWNVLMKCVCNCQSALSEKISPQ